MRRAKTAMRIRRDSLDPHQTAAEFAASVGLNVHVYRKYESGAIDPKTRVGAVIADALGCKMDDLWDWTGAKTGGGWDE